MLRKEFSLRLRVGFNSESEYDSTDSIMLPLQQTSRDLNGIPTQLMVQVFADRILVLVTQMGKVGTLVHLLVSNWHVG